MTETHDTIENIAPGTPEFEKRREENMLQYLNEINKTQLKDYIQFHKAELLSHRLQAEKCAVDAELNRRYAAHNSYVLNLARSVYDSKYTTKRRKNR